MGWKRAALIASTALLAACLGLAASVALLGPAPLLASPLGRALVDWMAANQSGADRPVAIGELAGTISLRDRAGIEHALPRPGRPLLLNYWASWCLPCREEMPMLAAFANRQPGRGTEVVGIALDTPEAAAAFLAQSPVSFRTFVEAPGLQDSSVRLGNARGILPFSVLIGADGRLLKRRFGAFSDAADLEHWAQTGQ